MSEKIYRLKEALSIPVSFGRIMQIPEGARCKVLLLLKERGFETAIVEFIDLGNSCELRVDALQEEKKAIR